MEFVVGDLLFPNQLRAFVSCARRTQDFLGCTELGKVAEIIVKTQMNTSYRLVYRLIELTLTLPVVTTLVEWIFSVLSIVKTDLCNKIGDQWLNHLMICYTEKEIFRSIKNGKIIKQFEDMKTRRMLVPRNNLVV